MKEIVIKISDEDYAHLIKNKAYFQAVFEQSQIDPSVRLALATINGIELPEGHEYSETKYLKVIEEVESILQSEISRMEEIERTCDYKRPHTLDWVLKFIQDKVSEVAEDEESV